jgi:hypothetical protein
MEALAETANAKSDVTNADHIMDSPNLEVLGVKPQRLDV